MMLGIRVTTGRRDFNLDALSRSKSLSSFIVDEQELSPADYDSVAELVFKPEGNTDPPYPTPPHKLNFTFTFKVSAIRVSRHLSSLSVFCPGLHDECLPCSPSIEQHRRGGLHAFPGRRLQLHRVHRQLEVWSVLLLFARRKVHDQDPVERGVQAAPSHHATVHPAPNQPPRLPAGALLWHAPREDEVPPVEDVLRNHVFRLQHAPADHREV